MADFFRKLFGTKPTEEPAKPKQVDMATTAPLSDQQINSIIANQYVRYETKQVIASVGQSVGKQREHNEDSLLAITSTIAGSTESIPFGLYIVADGMGGHQFGEVASNAAVRIMGGNITKKFHSYLYNLPTQALQESLQEVMESSVMEAHQYVQREAPGSGTTVTAALVLGQQVTIAHVGDSRAYSIYPDGRIEPITRDHSLVKRLEELGHLSKDEAANFPHRNVLIRALGQGESLEADVFTVPFPQAGYLMLCSDGLWGVISEKDIYRSIAEAPNLHRACQNMVEAANLAGGPDNITVILVQMVG
ncbi:MAG TPA: protein phosphatase 2C domain-containing protein [Anaerolineales bacterium]|nr:protein phosphatase 2C domain-containing protein [Anaerolineales bacterium]HMV94866.1 protein phosphatase 2C domain-containing protein [Anaerolineales bacterium]HMX17831.1 protein phosphatase 2C domain-containing protein [Anaerolineales bacterium]HMX72848.1 protein phosphatase 2C domain-containing protein [Anaerolineales bacterium]HMZ43285.1 protein phosphatase 2C domain-containing protein [Anaerolineales bacterium]